MPKFREWIASRSAATLASGDELYVRDASGDVSQRTTYGALTAVADAHIADTTDAHDASAVSVADTGGYFTGTEVETVLQEVGAFKAAAPSQYAALTDSIYFPCQLFSATLGTAVESDLVRTPLTLMDVSSSVSILAQLPEHWTTANAYITWTNATTDTGIVAWYLRRAEYDAGDTMSVPNSGDDAPLPEAPAQYVVAETQVWSNFAVDPANLTLIQVIRSSNGDTFPTSIGFLGLRVEKGA